MRIDLWLAQPGSGRILRASVRGAAVLCGLWGVLAIYSLAAARGSLAFEQSQADTNRKAGSGLAIQERRKVKEVEQLASVRTGAPDGPGSAEFADEIAQSCAAAGIQLASARIEASPGATPGPAAQVAQARAQASAPPAQGQQPRQPSGVDGGWEHLPFEISASGPFRAVVGLLDRITATPRVMEITSLEVTRAGIVPGRGEALLQLRIRGTVYGLPETP